MKIGKRVQTLSALLTVVALLCCATAARAAAAQGTVCVLVYHSFLGDKPFPSDISMQALKAQLDFLKDHGYRFVTLSEILAGAVQGPRNILVSIDDGNQSVYQAYQAVFKPRGIKPLLCIYPNIIGKKAYALTWEQLGELASAGLDIAAHGFYHFPLNQKAYDTDAKAFRKEIFHSKEILEKRLNTMVKAFAYPNGVNEPITRQTVQAAGYACAFTVVWGPVRCPVGRNPDRFALPRYMIYKNNWDMIRNTIIKVQ
ncbi:MAG: polysaccharide deacetylase family protein [Syntrophaceae bacterium]